MKTRLLPEVGFPPCSIEENKVLTTLATDITETELQKAAEFPAFLKSLDPGDEAAKLLIDGSRRVIVALRTFENGANFLAHVPMQNIVETYERCSCSISGTADCS
jgi:hypothetical protein